jgi:hypothetical protein
MRNTTKANQAIKSVMVTEDKPITEVIKSTALFHGKQQVAMYSLTIQNCMAAFPLKRPMRTRSA